MKLTDLRVICCVCCGRNDRPLRTLPGAMLSNLRACDGCLARFGAAALARESDTLLATATPGHRPLPRAGKCLHCGVPVEPQANGGYPAWCQPCHAELQGLRGGA